jgi:hypothetical protein
MPATSSLFTFLAGLILAACGSDGGPTESPPPPPPPAGDVIDVLALGNSLTYTWNVPLLVQQLAAAAGGATIRFTTRAEPNWSLEEHWADLGAQAEARSGQHDIVMMQQGASTLPASGTHLTSWTQAWAGVIRQAGARPALYQVWAPVGGDLDAAIANYEAAANAASTGLYPVGRAWREARRLDPTISLWSADGLHQGPQGAWLAALVIASVILDRPPADFPNTLPAHVTAAQLAVFRQAATTAIAATGRR